MLGTVACLAYDPRLMKPSQRAGARVCWSWWRAWFVTLHPTTWLACRGAFVLGVVAGLVYLGGSKLLLRLRIDDPLEACAVHGGCSLVGILGALRTRAPAVSLHA